MIITKLVSNKVNLNDIPLYDYQNTVLKYMIDFEYDIPEKLGFLTLPSGIGKTLITLALSKNNGKTLFVIPNIMVINYINRLKKFNIDNKIIITKTELEDWQANVNVNVVVTTECMLPNILNTKTRFERIIFDDVVMPSKLINLPFAWVITSDSDDYIERLTLETIEKCSIKMSTALLNTHFKHTNMVVSVIDCNDEMFTNAINTEEQYKTLLLNDKYQNICSISPYLIYINQMINLVEPYNAKLETVLNLINRKNKVVIFTANHHDYLSQLIYKKNKLIYKSMNELSVMNSYAILHNFNNAIFDGIIVNPNTKGITLIQAKYAIIVDNINNTTYENCIGRIMRKSRNIKDKLIVYRLQFELN